MNYLVNTKKILDHPNNTNKKLETLLRILSWKINQLTLKKPSIVQIEEEVSCICYPDSSFGSLVVYTKLPEYYEMKFVQGILRKNDVVIDIGANIGLYSLISAKRVRKVYAFEPVKQAADIFAENKKLNKFNNHSKGHEQCCYCFKTRSSRNEY